MVLVRQALSDHPIKIAPPASLSNSLPCFLKTELFPDIVLYINAFCMCIICLTNSV